MRANRFSNRNFMLCMSLVILFGCATGEKMTDLSPGMTRAEVVDTIGKPDGFKSHGDYVVMRYTNKLTSGWSWDRADYYVILRDDRVTEYGAGEVRERNVGGVYTVFLHQY